MVWNIDPAHSQVQFTVRHMMISNVRGRFEEFGGSIDFDPTDLSTLTAEIEIAASSINTREARRDAHLRSADFFDADLYPTVRFKSARVEVVSASHLLIHGDLTIRDITRPVTLETEFSGIAKSPWGTTSAGFSARTRINRKEWGLTWNQTLETGGILVGDEIKIEIEVEVMQAVEAEAVV